jgi:hypothetical protein
MRGSSRCTSFLSANKIGRLLVSFFDCRLDYGCGEPAELIEGAQDVVVQDAGLVLGHVSSTSERAVSVGVPTLCGNTPTSVLTHALIGTRKTLGGGVAPELCLRHLNIAPHKVWPPVVVVKPILVREACTHLFGRFSFPGHSPEPAIFGWSLLISARPRSPHAPRSVRSPNSVFPRTPMVSRFRRTGSRSPPGTSSIILCAISCVTGSSRSTRPSVFSTSSKTSPIIATNSGAKTPDWISRVYRHGSPPATSGRKLPQVGLFFTVARCGFRLKALNGSSLCFSCN